MKSLMLVLAFFPVLPACYQPYHGPQDASSDPAADIRDTVPDETFPIDLQDLTPEPDLTPDPLIDPAPDRDAAEVLPDAVEAAEDVICNLGVVGDPCSSPRQCSCVPSSARECLVELAGYIYFAGGYCSARCTSPIDCGEGNYCAEIVTGTYYCLKPCSGASQCRLVEGYFCARIPFSPDPRTYCLPIYDEFLEG